MTVSAEQVRSAFDELVDTLDVPLLVVTVEAGGDRAGCLIGFHTQVSIEPPRYLVALSQQNRTFRVARAATHLGIHTIPAARRDLAELFGGHTGDDVDKFSACRWRPAHDGTPVLADAAAWFVGRCLEQRSLGDHMGVLLEPVEVSAVTSTPLLTMRTLGPLEPGHEP